MSTTQRTTPHLLTLVDYHHPLLRQATETVQFPLSSQDRELIEDMKYSIQPEQLKKANAPWESAGGMAANQWGINKRIFLFCPEGGVASELEVVINPSYEPLGEASSEANPPEQDLCWESCFSVPLATGAVRRYTQIKVKYQNEDGVTIVRELTGWPARVWQHETDHLDGVLYDDINAAKCIDKKQFSSKAEVYEFYKIREAEYNEILCPCGTGKFYKDCCGIFLTKQDFPKTPEALMRSRYTAYVAKDMDYIQKTMMGPALLQFNSKTAAEPVEWLGLEVLNAYNDSTHVGYVEFIAKYKLKNKEYAIHELSEFHYENDRWFYIDGKHL